MNNKQNKLPTDIHCPECDTNITLPEEVKIGDVVECSACGAECEIVSFNPIKISPLEEEK